MFCFQCQEAAKNIGCTVKGVCGKEDHTAGVQDLLIYSLKGLSAVALEAGDEESIKSAGWMAAQGLFATITNANFDDEKLKGFIRSTLSLRDQLVQKNGGTSKGDAATWSLPEAQWVNKAAQVGVMTEGNEDARSLKELTVYGCKGLAAYTEHAGRLGYEDQSVYAFLLEALSTCLEDKSVDELVQLVLKTGETAVSAMALLDKANTETYGSPEITKVNIGVGKNPGILISGHDLRDMDDLLKQTEGTGVDVYTHSEMLPANYYPAFKRYSHFVGNYGSSWWKQDKEFASFNGPIVMTTNCITPVKDAYKDRIFTTGVTGYPGVKHIPEPKEGEQKNFSEVIALAKTCDPPTEIETGEIVGGFAHQQVLALADRIVDAVKSGAIKRFVVMAGCDGRQPRRSYFTEIAEALPQDAVILTAGCAKYRYNKLNLGEIGGIPRVLDAGQCNDSYSLAVIALKLKEVFGLDDINELPISFDLAWYEQKAVAVLLALLYLGVKGIRLGPTLPAFLSPGVAKVLVENFNIKPIGEVSADVEAMMAGA
ncbi:hydroxylamine reductase [Marispirochaeta sp.]|uniref:hydroxylamine reductase n=1 Tax=Marispirochaeta sp. TaxID=2038653 RepID=UPI0029C7B69D|nr:hydroxylamine reductase [Marispirochaeta sp.]